MSTSLLHQIALKKLNGIGASRAKKLVAYCGGVEAVFDASKKQLADIPGIGQNIIVKLDADQAFKQAEEEIKFIEKRGIKPIFYLDKEYPKRLLHCEDGPLMLYAKGNIDANRPKTVAIIGTRNATEYGKRQVEKLVEGLAKHDCLIVSGMAYGIDIIAHRAAVQNNLQTIGVLGHGLDRLYPAQHQSTADKMFENGGLFAEFESNTRPDRENFPQRNRIVAGMVDAVVVVETANKGGSMITAKLAADYHRDVFAFPGAVDSPYSEGCNHLIKTHQANLMESVRDLEYLLRWDLDTSKKTVQKQLFVELDEEERAMYDLLSRLQKASLDNLSITANLPTSKVSMLLLELEFKGLVQSLPGKMFTTC